MAQVSLPSRASIEQKEEDHNEQTGDDSWVRPPPGGPQTVEKNAMEIDISMSPPQQHPVRSRRDFSMEDLEVARALTGLRGGEYTPPMLGLVFPSPSQSSPNPRQE